MTREGLRVLVPAIASIILIAAAALVLEWFIVDINGAMDLSRITLDLREARACTSAGDCASVPMSMIKGSMYPTLATVSFWGAAVFALLLLYQAGTRMFGGTTSDSVIKAGHGLGSLVILTTVGAGYIFGPNLEPVQTAIMGLDFDRGWGPLAMLVGLCAGQVAFYFMKDPLGDEAPVIPIDKPANLPRAVAQTRVPLPLNTPAGGTPTIKPARAQTKPPYVARTQTPTTPPALKALAEVFKGRVKFAMVTGDVTMGGIDARREDGAGVLVVWRDVVGLVVRRLPPELDGHPFIDIVSTAGMTLRVLPWSKLTGEHFEGEGDTRVRSFMQVVTKRCTEARIDRATQNFLDDDSKRPAQLSNLELLARHDTALA